VSLSLTSMTAAAATEVDTPPGQFYVVVAENEETAAVWQETNGLVGLQTEVVRDGANDIIAPSDERLGDDIALSPQWDGCIDMPYPTPPFCPVREVLRLVFDVVEDALDSFDRVPICVQMPDYWNPPQYCV